jgi:hypothetical protein
MYNTKFNCTYKGCEDVMLSETLYRKDILSIFSIEDLDFEKHETEIYDEMLAIYDKISKNKKFTECVNQAGTLFSTNDPFIGFTILLSYDYLYLTHPCICEFLEKETISHEKIKNLLNSLLI